MNAANDNESKTQKRGKNDATGDPDAGQLRVRLALLQDALRLSVVAKATMPEATMSAEGCLGGAAIIEDARQLISRFVESRAKDAGRTEG